MWQLFVIFKTVEEMIERENIIWISDEGGVCDAVSLCRLGRRACEGGTIFGHGINTYQLSSLFSLVSSFIAFHHGIITLSDNITYIMASC